MRGLLGLVLAAIMASVAPSTSASATTLVVDRGWKQFLFACEGMPPHVGPCPGAVPHDIATGDLSYSFTLTAPALLRVTDVIFSGVIYDVYDDGVRIGQTGPYDLAAPAPDPADVGDPEKDFQSDYFSRLSMLLAPGDYHISFTDQSTEATVGRGAVSLISVPSVPEPASWTMAILGLGMAGAAMRARRQNAVTGSRVRRTI